ncbi:hypothetical protein AGMMS49975_01220 [Clostridia bacterium]|nr:hypothetical protein AGMMS49975_01220 [Clostridia bacterium]
MDKFAEYIKTAFRDKDKKTVANIVTGLILGIVILVVSKTGFLSKAPEISEPAKLPETRNEAETEGGYEKDLERRLSEILSQTEGAGKVMVMLKVKQGREIVVGEDTKRDTSRTASDYTESYTSNKIIVNDNPLVLTERAPRVEGIIIIAQGGGDAYVKESLIRAAGAVLDLPPHKIQVLKMKT